MLKEKMETFDLTMQHRIVEYSQTTVAGHPPEEALAWGD
jgi:hypothetical protein